MRRHTRNRRRRCRANCKNLGIVTGGMQEIIPDVWLGGKQDAKEIDERFKLVVNCTPDIPFVKQEGVRNVRLSVPDGQGEEQNAAMLEHLPGVIDTIMDTLNRGEGAVLVHCEAGRYRSATVIVALLVRYRGYSVGDSRLLVRSKCPEALKHDRFRAVLEGYCTGAPRFRVTEMAP